VHGIVADASFLLILFQEFRRRRSEAAIASYAV